MPKGKGTYGKKRGRPRKAANMQTGGLRRPRDPTPQQKRVIKFAKDSGLDGQTTEALLRMPEDKQNQIISMSRETTQDVTVPDLEKVLELERQSTDKLFPPKPKPRPVPKAYGGMMKAKKMMGGGMAGKKPRVGNMDYRKGGMVYSTKVKKG